ncbi:MAG: hypothetical protein HY541_06880 [Deltaproteobacteria bacterium]|nr:hypothetical protein [Deltaproteobacteria bacterium]
MAGTKSKKGNQGRFFKERLAQVNRVIEKLESEVEKAVARLMKRSEKSSLVLKKNFDEIIEKISSSDLYSKATAKKEELQKEIRHLADDVVSKIKSFDFRVANPLLSEIRGNLDQIVEKLQKTDLVSVAKDKVIDTRDHMLNVLSIPSQKEVSELSKKVVSLEKKLKVLTQKAA